MQIAANLHDDVGARLTKVAMVTELVDRETADGQPTKPHIRNIFRTVREITQAMDEIVWTINPQERHARQPGQLHLPVRAGVFPGHRACAAAWMCRRNCPTGPCPPKRGTTCSWR